MIDSIVYIILIFLGLLHPFLRVCHLVYEIYGKYIHNKSIVPSW